METALSVILSSCAMMIFYSPEEHINCGTIVTFAMLFGLVRFVMAFKTKDTPAADTPAR